MISKKKKIEIPQLKYFIGCVDTHLGQAIVEQVRNDQTNTENPHIILGTKAPQGSGNVSNAVRKVINNADVNVLTKTILDSDVIIYDLNTAKLDEVEYAIKTLKMSNYESEKYLILVSSVMAWASTPPKEKKEDEEEEEEVGEPEEGEEEEEPEPEPEPAQNEDEDEQPKKVYVSYKEKDYARRKPSAKYEIFKSIETLCLSAGNSKKNLLTYVLCGGILYGNGEETFANYFKQAWLQDPAALSYIGEGKNVIPTIHVRDLAMFVHFVVNKKPATRYIFAIDHTRKAALKNHVETISKGLGTGKVQSVSAEDMKNDPYLEVFQLNIKLQPSKIIEQIEAEEEAQEEEQPPEEEEEEEEGVEKPAKIPKFKFTWWCKQGMKRNIGKIVEEYNTFRGLKPIKIFISGQPGSGKTYFGSKFSKHYNIPHILISDVVKEVENLQNDFGEEVRTMLQEVKDKMIEEAEEKLEELKKKTKPGQPEPTVDPDKLIPRLPDDLLCKAFKYRLEKNDCFNRGFVLDGFPRTYDQAKGVFLTLALVKEDEEVDPDNPPMMIDSRKVPEFVVKLEASEQFLKDRVKKLPEESLENTHYTEEGMHRRLAVYNKSNISEGGSSVLSTFFKENNIDILNVNVEILPNEEIFNTIKIFVERKEKFKNYQNFEEVDEGQRKEVFKTQQEEKIKQQEAHRKIQDEKDNEDRLLQDEKARITLEALKDKEKKLLDARSLPLRNYLADQVVPILTSGIIQICKEKPEDPVDFLAEYLFKKSLDVKFPDPANMEK